MKECNHCEHKPDEAATGYTLDALMKRYNYMVSTHRRLKALSVCPPEPLCLPLIVAHSELLNAEDDRVSGLKLE